MTRIKITNVSNHIHAVRMLNVNTGTYFHRPLSPKQFMTIDEDQFLDLFNTTVDFESGILTFDSSTVPESIAQILGFETKEDIQMGVVAYTDIEIKALIKGKKSEFDKFMADITALEPEARVEFSKRVFNLAESMSDDMTQTKAKAIEDTTGMKFEINEEFKSSK